MASFKDLIYSDKPTLVDFYATWCGPCQMMPPILNDLKSVMGDKVNILKIDVDKNQKAALKYRIRSVPTLILFKQGRIVWQVSGVPQAGQLKDIVQRYV